MRNMCVVQRTVAIFFIEGALPQDWVTGVPGGICVMRDDEKKTLMPQPFPFPPSPPLYYDALCGCNIVTRSTCKKQIVHIFGVRLGMILVVRLPRCVCVCVCCLALRSET